MHKFTNNIITTATLQVEESRTSNFSLSLEKSIRKFVLFTYLIVSEIR